MNQILYENLTLGARVTYFTDKNMVLVDSWGDHSDEASYKLYFETFLKTYPYSQHACLLIDTTKLTKSTSSNRAWFSTSVAPRFFKGFEHQQKIKIAIVIPKGLFEKLAIEILIKAAQALGQKVQLKSFNDAVEAEKFVTS
jgi:hypothetical protein